jgi:ethanolamine ammonia-lyase small subunit
MADHSPRSRDPWHVLRRHTPARIGLGRSGDGLPTTHLLEFQMAHARARDAVHSAFDPARVAAEVGGMGVPVMIVRSAAADRATYLQRPDLGRQLAEGEEARLTPHAGAPDVVFVLADGLSARAVHAHGAAVLKAVVARLGETWTLGPIVVAQQARVALADQIGAGLGAAMTVILIGERPGLSAADSLGAYLTWSPRPGRSNAERNCVSNIRPAGLSPERAADTLAYLMTEARCRRLSGVRLKEGEGPVDAITHRPA